jgi:2,3-bisphosphoglycerate-dependent phosphoglycerate mutase
MNPVRILSVGGHSRELGPDHVIEALFTTISCRLEPQGRGTRFPAVTDDLYSGYLQPARAPDALRELQEIEAALHKIPVRDVVWNLAGSRPDDAHEPVNHHAANAFEYFVDPHGQPMISGLRDAVLECLNTTHVLRLAYPKEGRDGTLAGLVFALLGVAWMSGGRAWFPNWCVHPIGRPSAKMPIWTFGMDLVLLGAGIMLAYLSPGLRDWFRRHPPALVAVALIAPIAWLVICARAGFLPD